MNQMEPLKPFDEANNANSSASSSIVRSKSAERRWVVYITNIIEKVHDAKTDISSSIFIIRKFLQHSQQFLALGPYHHFLMEISYGNLEGVVVDDLFGSVLVGFCMEISPLNYDLIEVQEGYYSNVDRVVECSHILDLLYRMILPEKLECSDGVRNEPTATQNSSSGLVHSGGSLKGFSKSILDSVKLLRNFKKVYEFIERLIELLPFVRNLVPSMKEYSDDDRNGIEVAIEDKTPLMEAGIKVPTASELFDI